jgi:uncharacterized damage-inducible protein DinB
MKTILITLVCASAALAQAPDFKSPSGGAKAHYTQIFNNIQRSAEKMDEANYSFKPTPDVRSFGAILGHVADAQYLFCSAAMGEKMSPPGVEKTKTSKADIVAALKEASAYCGKAYGALTDSNANDVVKFFGGERSKLNVLQFNNMHNMEHYGNLVTYLRLKGVVPPSSEPRK